MSTAYSVEHAGGAEPIPLDDAMASDYVYAVTRDTPLCAPTALGQPSDHERIDSPLLARRTGSPPSTTRTGPAEQDPAAATRDAGNEWPDTRSGKADGGSGIRFVNVVHPNGLQNKAEMRKNRQHVMFNYLDKERQKPLSTDIRVSGVGQPRKRKQADSGAAPPSTDPTPSDRGAGEDRHRSTTSASSAPHNPTSAGPARRRDGRVDPDPADAGAAAAAAAPSRRPQRANISRSVARKVDDRGFESAPLVSGTGARPRGHRAWGTGAEGDASPIWGPTRVCGSLNTSLADVSFRPQRLGARVNVFDAWPTFTDSALDLAELKWKCRCRFGSCGMEIAWVPEMLKARHAFLSSVCISTAHDDIVDRSFQAADQRAHHEAIERARVRHDVTSMINDSLNDPQTQTADTTLIAVLHLLNAEVMGCDDNAMHIHQNGLHAMIQHRGGLDKLGINGQLAAVTTTTMYIIAALRETLPHSDFVRFAEAKDTRPREDSKSRPESPLYCRPAGYRTIGRMLSPDRREHQLLVASRQLTEAFTVLHTPWKRRGLSAETIAAIRRQKTAEMEGLAAEIFAHPPCADVDFKTMSDRYTYEAIRLTARLYAHALVHRLRFSDAAARLRRSTGTVSSPPLPNLIRDALLHTDMMDCWGPMIGVLVWIVLVAGAAANPAMAPQGYVARRPSDDDEMARKYLAAVVVRCSVLLGFEFGPSLMETMKRMIGIQEVLGRGRPPCLDPALELVSCPNAAAFPSIIPHGPATPPPAAAVQKGFTDFALELLGL